MRCRVDIYAFKFIIDANETKYIEYVVKTIY